MIREIDSRQIPGHGGTVELVMDTDQDDFFMVFVKDADGRNITTLGAKDGREAVELFLHPFATATTPDIFARPSEEALA